MDGGPLIDLLGPNGPRNLRIRKDAHVCEATRNGTWLMPNARSEETQNFLIALTAIPPPLSDSGNDKYMSRNAAGNFTAKFSARATWDHIRVHSPLVTWSRVLWFSAAVPRYEFISWLALRGRLPTRDRLRLWGLSVPASCVLCNSGLESHAHLFFECSYASAIWSFFEAAAAWILSSPRLPSHARPPDAIIPKLTTLAKLAFQATIYFVWKEHNSRIFTSDSSSIPLTRKAVDRTLRDRLLSFPSSDSSPSLLAVYFGCIPFL